VALKETIRMVCLSKIDGDVEMNAMLAAYTALGAAIILEVSGSTLLKLSQQFTKLWPSLGMLVCFILSLYAVWAGLGIVLTAVVSVVVFKMALDFWAVTGIAMIVGGVLVMNLLSGSVSH
jgi:small multidrug resistance pump